MRTTRAAPRLGSSRSPGRVPESHEVSRGGEHWPARPARGECQVGRDGMRVDAAHCCRSPALIQTRRCRQREDLLPARDGWCAAARAAKRHGCDRRHDRGVDSDHRDVALTIGFDDGPRDFDRARELHFDRRRVANDSLVRCDESGRVNQESRRVCSRSPHFDDAVEPLPQQERGVGRARRVCVCRSRRNRLGHRVGESQVEGRVAAGDDVESLRPVIRLSLKHKRLV